MDIVTITESAKEYLLKMCIEHGKYAVKLSVIGGGCAGFSYDYKFAEPDEVEDDDITISLSDNHSFIIDGFSLMYVVGTQLDYVSDLVGSSLKISNPNESSSCGCGTSFAV